MDGEIGQKVADDVAEKLNVRWLSALYCGARHLDMRDIGRDYKTGRFKRCQFKDA